MASINKTIWISVISSIWQRSTSTIIGSCTPLTKCNISWCIACIYKWTSCLTCILRTCLCDTFIQNTTPLTSICLKSTQCNLCNLSTIINCLTFTTWSIPITITSCYICIVSCAVCRCSKSTTFLSCTTWSSTTSSIKWTINWCL